MPLQWWMFNAIVVCQLVARGLCEIFDRHARRNEKFDSIVEPVRWYDRVNPRDIATDGNHVQLILAPGPEPSTIGKIIKGRKGLLQGQALGGDVLFGDAGQVGEIGIERILFAKPINRPNICFEAIQDRKLAFETQLDGSDLGYNRIRINRSAPKPALRPLDTQKLAIKYNSCLHDYPLERCAQHRQRI